MSRSHDASADQPPPEVTAEADRYQFGALVAARCGSNPWYNAGFVAGGALLCFAVTAVLALTGVGFLRYLGILTCAGFVGGAIFAIVTLIAGSSGMYLYTGGLVHTRRGRPRAVRWTEVTRMQVQRAGGSTSMAGRVTAYYVVTGDGSKLYAEARVVNGVDEFGSRLADVIAGLGRPVVDSGPG
jgi:hypothetical protein